MSIATEIQRLQSAKADIKTAIEGKGVTVPSSTKLDGYASLIDLIQGGDGLTNEVKQALLNMAQNLAYTTPNAQELYDALFEAFYPVTSISAVFNQGSAVIYDTDSLDDLKQYLTVTATYEGGTSEMVTNYTLSGTLTAGTSTITVSYGSKTTTFNAIVTSATTKPEYMLGWSITSTNGDVPYVSYTSASNKPRAMGVALVGNHPFRLDSISGSYSDYYPIEIPSGATGVKMTSNYLDVGCVEFYYNGSDWIRETSAGWLLKSSGTAHSYTFTGSRKTHIGIPFRQAGYTSGGNITQAMLDDITFEWL